MSVWTLWRPDYGVEGLVKALTAIASVLTAAMLWVLLPRAVALPSTGALREANEELQRQVLLRDSAVAALRRETVERKRAEEMLHHAQKLEAIGQLTGGIAHDFNNLLTVVVANLELLDSRLDAESGLKKYVERAMKGATRGAELTQQLLAFARRQPLRPTSLNVPERMSGLSEMMRATLGQTVHVEFAVPSLLWPVEADPTQLDSAVLNLAINARDAMPQGGLLTVHARNVTLDAQAQARLGDVEVGDYVAIAVTDTGTGMTPEVRRAAFDPFFTTKPIGQGSGLGLSQVYGFIKQSRGHVTLDSEPGVGTTVTLYLRRAAADLV
jgi:signal transduction histidine kinase